MSSSRRCSSRARQLQKPCSVGVDVGDDWSVGLEQTSPALAVGYSHSLIDARHRQREAQVKARCRQPAALVSSGEAKVLTP